MEKIPFTRVGIERLKEDLKRLVNVERPDNIRAIEEARAHGDLSENAEYHAAKERQSFLDGKINELKSVISAADVIEIDAGPHDRVVFGARVLVCNTETEEQIWYQVLGPYESDPDNGTISVLSPLGQGLIGKAVDDVVKIRTPRGMLEYEILEVR